MSLVELVEGLLSRLSSAGVLGEVPLGASLDLEIALEQHVQATWASGSGFWGICSSSLSLTLSFALSLSLSLALSVF